MTRRLPAVRNGYLHLENADSEERIVVGSVAWLAWLEHPDTRSYTFEDEHGRFTARKERRQRGAVYWTAYRKIGGKLRNVYLGKSADVTRERLATAAARLAAEEPPTDTSLSRFHATLSGTAMDEQGQLLVTKLHIPQPRASVIPRPRLINHLATGLRGKLTLISAPPGFGKTTLVSDWRVSPAGQAWMLAWVSLDPTDVDPPRFWSYVCTALDSLLGAPANNVGARTLALLRSPQPPPIETIMQPLLNALTSLEQDAALVLDDYHVVDSSTIHRALVFLLDHLPPRLHLIIITRADPPLPLSRLRAAGDLLEIRAADLRFTQEETAAFLNTAMGLPLPPVSVDALGQRTEGWITGLQFAAIALRGRAGVDDFVAQFTGSHRFVMDYLIEEVLVRQPAHLHTFLLQTAILDRMCGELCDAVLGVGGGEGAEYSARTATAGALSQLILEEVERANLFLIALDDERRWYRYHHLLADVLRQRLGSGASSEAVYTLHTRASSWFEKEDLIEEAVHHALAAQDWERAARLIQQYDVAVGLSGRMQTVLGWYAALPDSFVRARPALCVAHAFILMGANQLTGADARLHDAERAQAAASAVEERILAGEVAVGRANIARSRGDLARCVALGQQALRLLGEANAGAMLHVAHAFMVTGDVAPEVETGVAATLAPLTAEGNLSARVRSITLRAHLQVLQGRLSRAAATFRSAAEEVGGVERLRVLPSALAYFAGWGEIQRQRNNLVVARQALEQGRELVHGMLTTDADAVTLCYIALARVQVAQGEVVQADAVLEELADFGHQREYAAHLVERIEAARVEVALRRGDLPAAVRWANTIDEGGGLSFPREFEHLALVRVRIAQARGNSTDRPALLGGALTLIERLRNAAEAAGRIGSVIEILVLHALALHAASETRSALVVLERALQLAAPEGYVRVFADEGAPLAPLLALLRADSGASGERPRHGQVARSYAATLPAALAALGPTSTPTGETLSTRELDVLRLMAAAKSNQEIARILVIAVSTVKSHTNSIFGKLGVTSRTQAIASAHELDLL